MNVVGGAAWLAVGWTMLHFLWVGGLIGIAAGITLKLLRGAAPQARYGAGLASLAMLAAAPAVIGYRESLAVGTNRPVREPGDRARPVLLPPPVAGSVEGPSAPIARTESAGPAGVAIGGPVRVGVPRPSWATRLSALASRLPWIWLVGSPLTFAWLALGLAGAERLRRRGHDPHDGELPRLCRRLAGELGIAREVAVAACERMTAPVLVGIVRPLILLPAAALGGWGPDQVEMVLLHELAHVRRWDNLVNLLQRLIESAFFFHPAVWIVSGWVRREREHCCDAIVVGHTGRPRAYAEALLSLADRGPDPAPRAAVAMAGNDLVARVRRILNLEPEAHAMKLPRGLLALTAVILIVPAGFTIGHAHFAGRPGENRDEAKERGKPAVIQGRTVDEWLAALKNPDPAARRRAVEILGERALDPAIPPDEASRLQTAVGALLFTDEDASVRRAVASFAERARASDQSGGDGRVPEDRRTARRDQLRKIRDTYADLLKKKREALRKLAESVGSDDHQTLALRQQYAMEHLHYLQTELQGVSSQKRRFEAQLKVLMPVEKDGSKAPSLTDQEVAKLVEQHPAVVELNGQLAERQKQLDAEWASVRRISRNPSEEPSIKALKQSIKDLEESLARRRQEVRTEVIRQAAEDLSGRRIGREIAMLAELERRIADEIKSISKADHSLTVNTLDLRWLRDEIAQMQAAMERIEKELAALEAAPEPAPPVQPVPDRPAAIQGKTIDEWLAALKDRDPARRKRAVEVLGERSVDPDLPADERSKLQTAVTSLLSDRDAGVRKAAAFFADLPRASGSPELVERLLEEYRRTVAPTRRAIRLVDADGRPVPGALAGTFFSRDADHDASFTASEPTEVATSNARGLLALELEIPAHKDATGVYAIRQDEGQPLVGACKVTREELDKPIAIVMHPACRVRLRIECSGVRKLEEKLHIEPAGEGWWRAAYVWLGENNRAARPLFTSTTKGELEFLLPPGRFMIMAYGSGVKSVDRIIEVKPGHRVLDLGVIEVSLVDEMDEDHFRRGFWRSIRRDREDRGAKEHVTFRRPRWGRILKGDTREIQDLAFAPDGKLLATAHSYHADPGEVKLWDPATGAKLATFSVPDRDVMSVAFSPDGTLLAALTSAPAGGRSLGAVVLWDVAARRELRTLGGPAAPVSSLAFAPDGRTLATIGPDRALRSWDVATGAEARRIDRVGSGRVLAFAPDGRALAMSGTGGVPILWDVAGNRVRAALEPAREPFTFRSIAFSPDGRTLAAAGSVPVPGGQTGRVRLYDLTRDPPARRAELSHEREAPGGENQWAGAIQFTPDGRRVVGTMAAATAAMIVIWDAETGLESDSLARGGGGTDDRLAVSPDGRWLAISQPFGTGVTFLDISPPGPSRDAARPPG